MGIIQKFKDRLKVGLGHNTENKEQYSSVIGHIKSKSGLVGEVTITIEFDDVEWDKEYFMDNLKIDKEYKEV